MAGETDTFEITDETRRRITGAEVVRNLTTDAKLTGPWFAEELLVPDVGESALPSDIKIYAFYGQVGYGFARRALDMTVARASSRKLFGATLFDQQMSQAAIADVVSRLDAGRTDRAASALTPELVIRSTTARVASS